MTRALLLALLIMIPGTVAQPAPTWTFVQTPSFTRIRETVFDADLCQHNVCRAIQRIALSTQAPRAGAI